MLDKRGWRGGGVAMLVLGWSVGAGAAHAASGGGKPGQCLEGVLAGQVRAGEGLERRIGNGLEFMLEPLASGWIVRVVPATGTRGQHDYAELATPPYRSVSPLLIGTDWSFRAQDAVGWNPRRFRFVAGAGEFAQVLAAYQEFDANKTGAAEARLAAMVAKEPEGTLRILDAHLVPGNADQAGTAAAVASHFAETAHTLEQPADGKASALGKVTWMRFEVVLELPAGFRADGGMKVRRGVCR